MVAPQGLSDFFLQKFRQRVVRLKQRAHGASFCFWRRRGVSVVSLNPFLWNQYHARVIDNASEHCLARPCSRQAARSLDCQWMKGTQPPSTSATIWNYKRADESLKVCRRGTPLIGSQPSTPFTARQGHQTFDDIKEFVQKKGTTKLSGAGLI